MRFLALILLSAGLSAAQTAGWGALEFLVGDWTGEGSGGPGQGSGSFSFKPDLEGNILVRKNRAEYPATKERAASVHEDLMIIYRDDTPARYARAIYFDNEGHTITYEVRNAPEGDIVLESAPEPSAPRYRLTYMRVASDRVKIKFEIAPPAHPEEFSTYIEASARRASGSK